MYRFIVILFILSNIGQTLAQESYLSFGIQSTNYIGKGNNDNVVKSAIGGNIEFNFQNRHKSFGVALGMSYSEIQNIVLDNSIDGVLFTPFYIEWRGYLKTKSINTFWFLGYDFNKMNFEMTEGSDHHHLLAVGVGLHFEIAGGITLHTKLKPYFIFGNSLGQNLGINLNLNIGFILKRNSLF